MTGTARPSSIADVIREGNPSTQLIIDTIADYSNSGAAVGNATDFAMTIRDTQQPFTPEQTSTALKNCLHGTADFLQRGFPGDAEGWARLAVEFCDQARRNDLLSVARDAVSNEDFQAAINLAGQSAISFHRMAGDSAAHALETGHLLTLARGYVYSSNDTLNIELSG